MALMLGKVYGAFRKAGVPDEDAIAAAEELAGYENRLAAIERRLDVVQVMVGVSIALNIAILVKLFVP